MIVFRHAMTRFALAFCGVLLSLTPISVSAQIPPEPDRETPRVQRVVVQIQPATNWRPRGGEVLFSVTPREEFKANTIVRAVWARFCWSRQNNPPDCAQGGQEARLNTFKNGQGELIYSALVPRSLDTKDDGLVSRVLGQSNVQSTMLGAVPVAWLETIVQTETTSTKDAEARFMTEYHFNDIGITNTWLALIGSGVTTAIALLILQRMIAFMEKETNRGESWLKAMLSDGTRTISLSQTQIMAWSFVVFSGGCYVLLLSGTLIGLPDSMLALLGIQSVTTVVARSPNLPDRRATVTGNREPRWSDMIALLSTDSAGSAASVLEVDVTRVQALIATALAIGYVMLSIVNNYEIPDIPQNFVYLMGLSNGTYLAGRFIPPKSAAPKPTTPDGAAAQANARSP